MLRNYVKVILRNLWRFKAYSFINLFGLALGMSVCLLAFFFVRYERMYDAGYDSNIYRLYTKQEDNSSAGSQKIAKTMLPVGPALQREIAGVETYNRIIGWEKMPLQKTDGTGTMATVCAADSNFLSFWGLQLLTGHSPTALHEPGSIVLTESLARKMFGNANPLGQQLRHEGRDTQSFKVTGILADITPQSHLQFDAVFASSTIVRPEWNTNWEQSWVFTYLKLKDKTVAAVVENALPQLLQRHAKPQIASSTQLFLQPLQDVHLHSPDILYDAINTHKFDGTYLPLIMAVGIFILLLAMINYVNLHTARILTNAKEVGVRKTIGAGYPEILMRFLLETFVFSLMAFLLSLLFLFVSRPLITIVAGKELAMPPVTTWIGIAFLFVIGTSIIAGTIPAIAMARIDTLAAVKGRLLTQRRLPLRNALVVLQFTIATGLFLGSAVVIRQLQFVRQYDLGFNKENVIVLPVSYTDRQVEENLMQRLKQIPGITNLTGALRRLGSPIDQNDIVFRGSEGNQQLGCFNMYIDFSYVSFYKIQLLAGRDLSSQFGADWNGQSYIINETLARKLLPYVSHGDTSIASLVGKPLRYTYEDSLGTITGIVRDFNFGSLHQRIEPLVMSYQYEYYFPELSARVNMQQMSRVLKEAEQVWKEVIPAQQFSWRFLDEDLQELYKSDQQTGNLITVFTIIALVISILGLTGVTAYVIGRRTKEIGIRKVLGASVRNILLLLSKEMLLLIVLSICIALPVSWWASHAWLGNFAYHAAIDWLLFAIIAAATLLLAAITISIQAVRAANINPAFSLRSE